MSIITSLAFWTLIAGFLGFAVKFLFPTFPFTSEQILAAIVFILGSIGIVPTLKFYATLRGVQTVNVGDLLKSLQFWSLLAGLVSFVIHYYSPTFPFYEAELLALIVYILGFFDIVPALKERGFLK